MDSPGKIASSRRYLPGLILLLLAIGLAFRVSEEPAPSAKTSHAPDRTPPPSARYLKSRDRSVPAATFPQLRPPVTVTSADEIPISPEEARVEFADIAKFDSPTTRGKETATLIRRLCRSGYFAEAFAAIDHTEPVTKEVGITAFFLSAPLDDAAIISEIKKLPDEDDAMIAFAAYLRRVPVEQIRLILAKSGDLSGPFVKSLDAVLDLKLKSPTDRGKAEALIEELHPDGLASDNLLGQKILGDPTADPFEKWELLRKRLSHSPRTLGASWKYCLNQMIEKDPARTADYVTDASGNSPNEPLQNVLIQWSAKDPEAALRWYEKRQSTSPDSFNDAAAIAFMVRARIDGRPDQALAWIEKVRNPEIRERLSQLKAPPGKPVVIDE